MLNGSQRALALSPDGARLAYLAGTRDRHHLQLRALDQAQSVAVPDSEGADDPFFSPDGQWVAFFAAGSLKKAAVAGGAPVTLCPAGGLGGSWGADGTIAFSGGPGKGLMRVAAAGGKAEALTTLDAARGEGEHAYAQFLPGGRSLLYTVTTARGAAFTTVLHDLASGERRELLKGFDARYLPSGHLVYGRRIALMASRFDLSRRALVGDEIALVDDVRAYTMYPVMFGDLAADGSFVYGRTTVNQPRRLVFTDREGQERVVNAPPGTYETARLAPDGRSAVVTLRRDAWSLDLERGTLTRLTFGPGESYLPVLSPDGKRVAYSCARASGLGLCVRPADASGAEDVVLTRTEYLNMSDWTPDGATLLYTVNTIDAGHDIWRVALAGNREPQPLLQSRFDEQGPALSPDGRWLAYSSDESGLRQVFVQAFPGLGSKVQVSVDGGDQPVWSRSGRELFYRREDEMMAVPVQAGAAFHSGPPRLLFSRRYLAFRQRPDTVYAAAADGRHFLMIERIEGYEPRLTMVLHLADELRRRLP
jgi:serine/threonine-protein kinase